MVARVVLALAISTVQHDNDRGYAEKVENDCGDQGPGLEHEWLEVDFWVVFRDWDREEGFFCRW
jgi:hypothetical protein